MPASVHKTDATKKFQYQSKCINSPKILLICLAQLEQKLNYRTAKIFELENIEPLPKRKQEQIVLERSARLNLDPKNLKQKKKSFEGEDDAFGGK